jgi:2-C-methyl-D-erythritol 4-phosphate cytidylyltransferase
MPKAFVHLHGQPLLRHALDRVLAVSGVGHIVVVAPADDVDRARAVVADASAAAVSSTAAMPAAPMTSTSMKSAAVRTDVVAGGADRSASVSAGLRALLPGDDIVLVHDAARALAPAPLFEAVAERVRAGSPAVVPGLPVTDTVKVVDASGRVTSTPPRESLRGIQTPQGFRREILERAHAAGSGATDDAALVELTGVGVTVIDGDPRAVKVTSPRDLALALTILQEDIHGTG